MATDRTGDREPRRPLLGGGEQLRGEAEWRRGGRPQQSAYSVFEQWEQLAPQAVRLLEDLRSMPAQQRVAHMVVEATLLPSYFASTHYPKDLIEGSGLYQVGSKQARGTRRTASRTSQEVATKTLLLAGPDDALLAFAARFAEAPREEADPRWIEPMRFASLGITKSADVIRGVPPEHGDGELFTWEAVLSSFAKPGYSNQLDHDAFEKFDALVQEHHGYLARAYRRQVGAIVFVPVVMTVESARQVAAFNVLRAVRPMPMVRGVSEDDIFMRTETPAPAPPSEMYPMMAQPIAVIDGGVDPGAASLSPFVTQFDVTPEAPLDLFVKHGTMVTSAALYGYHADLDELPRPIAPVHHYRVFPPPIDELVDARAYWLLDQVVNCVSGKGYHVVNLSIGPARSVEDDAEPDRWSATLDQLARTEKIVFVTAAGNNGGEPRETGQNRVQVPADMANGIAVGACLHRGSDQPIKRARYSAVGPGRPGQRLVPTVVGFGGNVRKGAFLAIGMGGEMYAAQGTSLAAPLVTRSVAELEMLLGTDRATPQARRAFVAHFAERRPAAHTRTHFGHGRARESFQPLWDCQPHEVTVLYQATMERGDKSAMYLPFVEGLNPSTPVHIEYTIAYQSEVDPADAADYTQTGFEVYLRPDFWVRSVRDVDTKASLGHYNLRHHADELAALGKRYTIDWSTTPVAHGSTRPRWEGTLRESGRWETIARTGVTFSAGDVAQPRIDLNHLSRRAGILSKPEDTDAVDVALLVTISADGIGDFYDRVRARYQVLTPIVQQLETRVLIE